MYWFSLVLRWWLSPWETQYLFAHLPSHPYINIYSWKYIAVLLQAKCLFSSARYWCFYPWLSLRVVSKQRSMEKPCVPVSLMCHMCNKGVSNESVSPSVCWAPHMLTRVHLTSYCWEKNTWWKDHLRFEVTVWHWWKHFFCLVAEIERNTNLPERLRLKKLSLKIFFN